MAGTSLTSVSLFSGGMGLDLGLERAGFRVAFAADNMGAAVETMQKNRPSLPVFSGDIRLLSAAQIRAEIQGRAEVDLLTGGPPCQSFSTAGKRLGVDDPASGALVFEFIRLLRELRPRAFLMENVKGILSASLSWRELPYNNNGKRIDDLYGSLLAEVLRQIRDAGYSVDYSVLNAADFGVPQVRQRVFFLGFRDGRQPSFPEPTHHSQPSLFAKRWQPIRSVLQDLTSDDSFRTKFSERKLRYLRLVPAGGNWRNLPEDLQRESMGKAFLAKGGRCGYWRRLSFDAPAPTILTEPQNASTALCHPVEDRPLTVRECARIQTFPDDWQFCGRGLEQYRLVGNAVPVALAQALGEHVREALGVTKKYRKSVTKQLGIDAPK